MHHSLHFRTLETPKNFGIVVNFVATIIYSCRLEILFFKWNDESQKVLQRSNLLYFVCLVLYSVIAHSFISSGPYERKYIVGYNSTPAAARNYSQHLDTCFQTTAVVSTSNDCDHSALTYILNSKRPIVTNRLDRLVRALHKFNFSI